MRNSVIVSLVAGVWFCAVLPACQTPAAPATEPAATIDRTRNPDARYFEGTVQSLHHAFHVLVITTDKYPALRLKYDKNTRFFLSGQPATIADIQQYMPIKIWGHMVYPPDTHFNGVCMIDSMWVTPIRAGSVRAMPAVPESGKP